VIPAYRKNERSRVVELMDAEPCGYEEFAACLRDIARINAATNAHAPTIAWLAALARTRNGNGRPLRVLDVGCGYGDTLRAIARDAARREIPLELVGIDINPWAKRAAEAATPPEPAIRFETADLFAYDGGDYDAIVSSLFAHHLDDDGAVTFLRWMHANAKAGWFVNDLHRHVVPYAFIALATRAARLHRFVRNDAPLSVARAFRRRDWDALIARASLTGAAPRVRWEPLFRYCVAWER
jgi:SAM-dependent methyltransferase